MNRSKSQRPAKSKASRVSNTRNSSNVKSSRQASSLSILSNSSASSPITTPRRHKSASVVNILFNRSTTKAVPLDRVHPDAELPNQVTAVKRAKFQTTQLDNGIKITTEPSVLPRSYISLSVDAGSRHENADTAGLTSILERSMVRSTDNRDVSSLILDLGKLGADISTQASRENIVITATTPTKINPVLGAIRDIVRHPAYTHDDVMRDLEDYRHSFIHHTQDITINESLHQAAFGPTGLGRSIYAPKSIVDNVTGKNLKAWHQKIITPDRMSIAAVGVEHDSFVALVNEMFGDMKPSTTPLVDTPTQYQGKQLRTTEEGYAGPTHVAIAYNAPSIKSDNAIAANILQMILGGGASFSSGGPGKGMYSRLYRQVLGQHPWISNVNSFYSPYSDAGLFGIYGSVEAEGAGAFTEIAMEQLNGLTKLHESEVDRAKNMLRSQIISHYEFESARVEELARHMQLFNQFKYQSFLEQLDKATVEGVQNMAKEILATPLTLTTLGDSSYIPRL